MQCMGIRLIKRITPDFLGKISTAGAIVEFDPELIEQALGFLNVRYSSLAN